MADAELTLRNVLDKIMDERDYNPREVKIKAISSGGGNYTSSLFLVDVSSPSKEGLKLFAKVGSIGNEMRKRMNADWLYDTERYVYTELMNYYEKIQDTHSIKDEHRFVFPKFYGYNAEVGKETIVLENLIEDGYVSYNRCKSVDWHSARAAVENLAKLHALSFAFESEYPDEFYKTIPKMKFRLGSDEPDEAMKPLWNKMVNGALSVIKEEQREKIEKYVMDETILKKYNLPIGRPVLCHGDYRLSNLLFKGQGDELTTKVLDFQTIHAGCPAGDLIYFLFLCSDEEFRSQYYQKLLNHYYKSLEEALRRLALNPVEVYSREKFDSDIKQILPFAALIGVMVLPIVTVEAQNAPKIGDDADINDFAMEPNELYAYRFSGIVNDCFKLGAF